MWNTADISLLRSGPSQAVYRWIFQLSFLIIYWISKCCHFFKLRYNPQTHRVEETQYHKIISKLIVTAKCCLFLRHIFDYIVFFFVIWIHVFIVQNSDGQDFIISLAMEAIAFNVLRRILMFLHCQDDRGILKRLLNEIIYITRTIQKKFGLIYHCEISLLGVYLCKVYMTYVLLESLWYKPYFLWPNFLYWVLLEYCEFGYFIYQLILINWYRNFGFFLQSFIEHHEHEHIISRYYHQRLLWLFKLHLRICKLHKSVNKEIAWLPSAIYLGIFTCIFNMELLLECIVYADNDIEDKVYIIADGCLGPMLVPLLNVLILGLCTDRLRNEELTLQQQIVIVNIIYFRKANHHDYTLKGLHNEYCTSLIVHQKVDPLQNIIIFQINCDREFSFDYLLTVLITALSFIQYTVGSNRSLKECVSHK
ncbi:uncharacterized protein CG1339 [Drosophila nasuta]|uniref:uncharacterized protein CG1339 n=1 Tax=Drosophila nasuta TaxID=42062 RepID=UPI00295F54CF|nr:uncharacterized protein CG1339 [Drosophila nasuta]